MGCRHIRALARLAPRARCGSCHIREWAVAILGLWVGSRHVRGASLGALAHFSWRCGWIHQCAAILGPGSCHIRVDPPVCCPALIGMLGPMLRARSTTTRWQVIASRPTFLLSTTRWRHCRTRRAGCCPPCTSKSVTPGCSCGPPSSGALCPNMATALPMVPSLSLPQYVCVCHANYSYDCPRATQLAANYSYDCPRATQLAAN